MLNGYKTLIGSGVAFLAALLQLAGIDIGDQAFWVNAILTLGGTALAFYGRVVATRRMNGEPLQ